jgi:hypothetical protein
MALARLGREKSWLRVAEHVREHWRYGPDAELPEPVAESPADSADFAGITSMMAEEDELLRGAPHLAGQPAAEIDDEVFYRTWALALLLCFESTAPASHRDNDRIATLVGMAERKLHDGYYYPRRVPWLTARMVLGLCLAGQRYHTHDAIRQACRWLQRPLRDGGAFERWWRSGTGSWNSDEATTATCLSALLRAGVPLDDELTRDVMASAFAWLDDRESAWTAVGREIDLAQVLEAVLLRSDGPRIDPRHVEDLLGRMLSALNGRVSLPRGPQDNVRVPLVTAQLGMLVWTTVWRECASLFEDMVETTSGGTPAEPTGSGDGASGGDSANGSGNGRVTLAQRPNRVDGTVILSRHELGAWRNAAEQLRVKISDQIENRAAVFRQLPGAKETAERLRHYRQHRERCEQLTRELERTVPLDVLSSLDELGREVCGLAWPRLPWPDGGRSLPADEPDDGAVLG